MQILKNTMTELNIDYNDINIDKFKTFMNFILDRNEKVNLTAVKDPNDFETRHFVDSLMCCTSPVFKAAKKIIDIGTGAGFPGIPLAICFPEKEFVLLDSLNKRIIIVNEAIKLLELRNVTAVHARAEDFARNKRHREQYDICLSRAVANLAVLAEYCMPFVRTGGFFGAYKTEKAEQEIKESEIAVRMLGGKLADRTRYTIKGVESDRQIVWIEKTALTPLKYPRKAGIPEKEPIK